MSKMKFICLILVLIMALSCGSVMAADDPSFWAEEKVSEAIFLGLVPEDLQTDYDSGISRLDYCRLTITLIETVTSEPIEYMLAKRGVIVNPDAFSDTDDMSVLSANALGIVSGIGGGKFAPQRAINRAEAAVMLMRTANLMGDYSGLPYVYDDARHIPQWAREAVYAARESGVMSGSTINTFMPDDSYTREAAIITVMNLYENLKGKFSANPGLFPMCAEINGEQLWGYTDKSGKFVIEPRYAYASEWNDGYGIVSAQGNLSEEGRECFVIDITGERVADGHRYAGDFPLGSLDPPSVRFYGNHLSVMWGGRDAEVTSFSEGMLGAWAQDQQSYSDRSGNVLRFGPPAWGGAFYDGVAVIGNVSDNTYYLIDKNGKTLYTSSLDDIDGIIISGMDGQVGNLIVSSKAVKDPANGSKTMYTQIDQNGNIQYKKGVVRADGKTILPPEYRLVRLTAFQQIIASKNGEPYTLYSADGKQIYQFPGYITGALHSDGIGHYLYRASETKAVILSVTGEELAVIALAPEAKIEFVSGLVKVMDDAGCRYFDVTGKIVIERRDDVC